MSESVESPSTGESLVGIRTLARREVLRYIRRPKNTFMPPLISNFLYFAVFGVVLGGRIREIQGLPYIEFILPGLIALGMISNAFENACFSVFHGRWNHYIHEVLTSPLSHAQIVIAYLSAAVLRAFLIGILIACVAFVFTPVRVHDPLLLVAFGLVLSVLFAAFGLMAGLAATDWDQLSVYNQFIIRPLVFFGGVFYSLEILPPFWRTVSLANPMVYIVNGVRYGMLGITDINPTIALGVLVLLTTLVVLLDITLVRRGYGLRE